MNISDIDPGANDVDKGIISYVIHNWALLLFPNNRKRIIKWRILSNENSSIEKEGEQRAVYVKEN